MGIKREKTIIDLPILEYLKVSSYGALRPIEATGYFAIGRRYIHSPLVEWQSVDGVSYYQLVLVQVDKVLGVTRATNSPKTIEKGWNKVRVGKAGIIIQGFNAGGERIALSRIFPFYVAEDFDKSKCSKMKRPYIEAAMKSFNALYNFKLPESSPAPTEGPGSKILPVLLTCAGGPNGYPPRSGPGGWMSPAVPRGYALYSFPSLHDPIYADMLMEINKIADRELKEKVVKYAHSVGDHILMCRMPTDGYVYGNMIRGCADFNGGAFIGLLAGTEGMEEKLKRLVEPAKCGYPAEALVKVYELTKDTKYLDGAVDIAEVLVKTQREDGSWPSRVDAKTGEVIAEYCSCAISVVSFMDRLNQYQPDSRWVNARDRAVQWLLHNPVKTYGWVINYDDAPAGASKTNPYKGLSNFDLFAFIRYLSEHPEITEDAASCIKECLDWNDNHFVFYGSDPLLPIEPFYPCCAEQGQPASFTDCGGCWVPMDYHTANLARAFLAAYRLTKDKSYLEKAKAAANTLTQYQVDDGTMITWMCDRTFGLSAHYAGTSGTHNFWPSAWAICACVWAELAAMETEQAKA